MAKATREYTCDACGAKPARMMGKCPRCGEFGTITETVHTDAPAAGTRTKRTAVAPAAHLHEVNASSYAHVPTGMSEVDRVFSGGLVKGQTVLLAAAPGAGKSTLTLQLADRHVQAGGTALIVSGEESVHQIKLRADRLGVAAGKLHVSDNPDLGAILAHIDAVNPTFLVVDSLQTVSSSDIDGRPGGPAQVHEAALVLNRTAKARGITTVMIAQVLKDTTTFAGPQAISHEVDATAHLSVADDSPLRTLRLTKNRFGSGEYTAYLMHETDGLHEVPDPSGMFLDARTEPVAGVARTVTMDGTRPLVAELQALIAPTNAPNPRRGASGLDTARAMMLLAVTERRGRIRLHDSDAWLATVGGIRIHEPAADLALCLAVASAASDTIMPADLLAVGEVTLSGELRPVPMLSARLTEAARLGFTRALVPAHATVPPDAPLTVIRVDGIARAIDALRAA